MTVKTILTALGTLAVRLLQLAGELCVAVVSVLVQAAWAGADKSDDSCSIREQAETDEYYSRAAANHYEDW